LLTSFISPPPGFSLVQDPLFMPPDTPVSDHDESLADWYTYQGRHLHDSTHAHTFSPLNPAARATINDDNLYEMSRHPQPLPTGAAVPSYAQHPADLRSAPTLPQASFSPGSRPGSFESDRGFSSTLPVGRSQSAGTATSQAPLSRGMHEKGSTFPSPETPASMSSQGGFNYKRPPFSRNSSTGWTQIAPTEADNPAHPAHTKHPSESRPHLEFAEGDFMSQVTKHISIGRGIEQ
jgi:hypothetical protein